MLKLFTAVCETTPWIIAYKAKRARRIFLAKHYPNHYRYLK